MIPVVVVVSASNTKLGEGLYDEALESFRAALVLFEGMGNQRGIGICANNIGICYSKTQAILQLPESSRGVYDTPGSYDCTAPVIIYDRTPAG
jgi:peptide deformylase